MLITSKTNTRPSVCRGCNKHIHIAEIVALFSLSSSLTFSICTKCLNNLSNQVEQVSNELLNINSIPRQFSTKLLATKETIATNKVSHIDLDHPIFAPKEDKRSKTGKKKV